MDGIKMLNVLDQSNSNVYKLNSQGYRCPEFNTINWSSSFAVIGCSRIFGESLLDDTATVPGQLESISKINTVNLGVCGSGIDLILFNTMKMIDLDFIPKAVFILWPDPERFLKFKNEKNVFYGSWSNDKELEWIDFGNALEHSHQYATIIKHLWKTKNVPVIDISHHAINESITDIVITEFLDYAPDGIHWGSETCRMLAEKLFKLYAKSN
jgi:hypothetical protein